MHRSDGLGIVVVLATGLLIGASCNSGGASKDSKGTAGSSSGAGGTGGDGGGAGITGVGGVGTGGSSGKGGAIADAGASGGASGSDAASDAPLGSCPASQPSFGTKCTGNLSCEYGHSSCCGIPSSAMTCVCSFGYFDCSQTVECNFICPDAGGN
jgi:hypothetical protein